MVQHSRGRPALSAPRGAYPRQAAEGGRMPLQHLMFQQRVLVYIRNRPTKGARLDGDPGSYDPPGRERNAGLTQADRPEGAATEHVDREDPAGLLHGLLRGRPGGEGNTPRAVSSGPDP